MNTRIGTTKIREKPAEKKEDRKYLDDTVEG
jgi:hypothetical protein